MKVPKAVLIEERDTFPEIVQFVNRVSNDWNIDVGFASLMTPRKLLLHRGRWMFSTRSRVKASTSGLS